MNDTDYRPLPPEKRYTNLNEEPTGLEAPEELERQHIEPEAYLSPAPLVTEAEPTIPTAVVKGAAWWQRLLPLGIAATVILLDQYTKGLVEANLPLYQSWAPIPAIASFFRITHATNTGAAFGLFQGGGWLFGILATIVALAIIYYSLTLSYGFNLLRIALGLQLGGAVGNLFDRIQLGHVTDFLDFGPWPIFNLADTAIVSGVVLLAWMMLREERQLRQAQKRESENDYPSPPHLWRDTSNESSTQID